MLLLRTSCLKIRFILLLFSIKLGSDLGIILKNSLIFFSVPTDKGVRFGCLNKGIEKHFKKEDQGSVSGHRLGFLHGDHDLYSLQYRGKPEICGGAKCKL